MKFSPVIINFTLLGVLLGLSYLAVSFFGALEFSNDFELITGTPFAEKAPLLVLLTSSLLGTYISVLQIWLNEKEKVNFQFAIIYGVLILVASFWMISWLTGVESFVIEEFTAINYPNDVDELTKDIRVSLINSASLIFKLLFAVGGITLGIIFITLKRSFNVEN